MAAPQYNNVVAKSYLAYYGRPADVGGLAYWTAKLDSLGGNLSGMIDAFANSAEANALYGGLSSQAKISKIYQQLFGHDADSGGLAYYSGQLASGKMSIASIMLNIADGATGSDATKISGNIAASLKALDQNALSNQQATYAAQLNPGATTSPSGNSNNVELATLKNGFTFDASTAADHFTINADILANSGSYGINGKIQNFGADDSLQVLNAKSVLVFSNSNTANVEIMATDFNSNYVDVTLIGVNPNHSMIYNVDTFNALSVGKITVS